MPDKDYLQNRVVIMNGFNDSEINTIMNAVKKLFPGKGSVIFAKTTPNSLEMKLGELIIDMSQDHEYLQKNPPGKKPPEASTNGSTPGQTNSPQDPGGDGE